MSNTKLNKNQVDSTILTSSNFIAGTGISIDEIPQPMIDENTLGVWHFENNLDNAVSGSEYQITTASQNFTSDYKKFGSSSQYDNKNAYYVLFPNKAFSNSFTLDFWGAPGTWLSKMIGLNTSSSATSGSAYQGPFYVTLEGDSSSAKIYLDSFSGSNYIKVSPDSWHHIALEVNNGTGYIFIDGKLKYTKTGLTSSYYIHVFQNNGGGGSGIAQPKIDELRLSNIARWTSDFTPYTEPYSSGSTSKQYQINTFKNITGYNTSNTQKLKNVEGVLTWVNEN